MEIFSYIKRIFKIRPLLSEGGNADSKNNGQSDFAEKHDGEKIIPGKLVPKVAWIPAAKLYCAIETGDKQSLVSEMSKATFDDINGEIEFPNLKTKLLHIVIEKGDKEILDAFLQGLKNLKDLKGLDNSKFEEKINLLFEAKDSNQKTALEKAVEKEDGLAVELMIKAGIDVEDVIRCIKEKSETVVSGHSLEAEKLNIDGIPNKEKISPVEIQNTNLIKGLKEQSDILQESGANSDARGKQDIITSGRPSNSTQLPANRVDGGQPRNIVPGTPGNRASSPTIPSRSNSRNSQRRK